MKLLSVIALCALAAAASGASLEPRDEAVELLLETAQLDSGLDKNEHNKRSFGSSYNSYSPAFAYEEPHVPDHYPKSTGADLWGFKRAILGALYSAVRAVAGGSIAVKGQVIKGAGNLVAAQGKLVASGGQAVSDFGRNMAVKALHSAPTIQYHPTPAHVAHTSHVSYGAPAYAAPAYAAPAYAAPAQVYSAPAYVSAAPAYHHRHQDGVLTALSKAKAAKVNVAASVGNAVGNAVVGAAGAITGAVGSAAAGAAKLAVNAASGAANLAVGAAGAVSNHVANKFNSHATVVPAGYVATPAAGVPYKAYGVPTYGGSLEDSFGDFDDGSYKYPAEPTYNIQPSISYDLH